MTKALAAIPLAMLLLGACSAQGGVTVTMDEYTMSVRPDSDQAGTLTFTARNQGGIAHQMLILRTKQAPGDLPVNKSGIVRLDAKGIEPVGEIPIIAEGDSEQLTVDLTPGRYTLICNIAGHYGNGMYALFRVS